MDMGQTRKQLDDWARSSHSAFLSMADVFQVARSDAENNPLVMLGPWEQFTSRLPLDQFEDRDWVWLQTEIAVFLAEVLIQVHGGYWQAIADPSAPSGSKYVVRVNGLDAQDRDVDPLELAYEEVRNKSPRVIRALGRAEVIAGVAPDIEQP